MKTIRNWTAVRSGPTQTVAGWDDDGERVKITGVAEIVSAKGGCVATLKADGDATPESYFLAVNPAPAT